MEYWVWSEENVRMMDELTNNKEVSGQVDDRSVVVWWCVVSRRRRSGVGNFSGGGGGVRRLLLCGWDFVWLLPRAGVKIYLGTKIRWGSFCLDCLTVYSIL